MKSRVCLFVILIVITACCGGTQTEQTTTDGGESDTTCYSTSVLMHPCSGVPQPPEATETVGICNGCLTDEHCDERPGGRCALLPGTTAVCAPSGRACLYPEDDCFERIFGGSQNLDEGRCMFDGSGGVVFGQQHAPPP